MVRSGLLAIDEAVSLERDNTGARGVIMTQSIGGCDGAGGRKTQGYVVTDVGGKECG